MTLVSPKERDAALRGVVGSEKYGAKATQEERGSEEEEDPRLAEEKAGTAGKVVFFWMELHQNLIAELLWESRARVLVDFTPGAGMALKTALTLGVKSLAIGHTPEHVKLLTSLMRSGLNRKSCKETSRSAPSTSTIRLTWPTIPAW